MDERIRLIQTRLTELENEKLYLISLQDRIERGETVGNSEEDLVENTLFEGTFDQKLPKEYYVLSDKEERDLEFKSIGIHRVNEIFETAKLKFTLEGNFRNGIFKIELKEDELKLVGNYKFDCIEIELSFTDNQNIRVTYQGANLENLNYLINKYEINILNFLKLLK